MPALTSPDAALWLPEPPPGTPICLGFDGADVDDWCGFRAETLDGFQFTPRFGRESGPAVWIPKSEQDGRVSHTEVANALDEIVDRFAVKMVYADTPRWTTDVEQWAAKHGDEVVVPWETYRPRPMFEALERFRDDCRQARVTHDGCPLTATCMANARALGKGQQYKLGKPNAHQKIDLAIASVLAHEAACDARANGWTESTNQWVTVW